MSEQQLIDYCAPTLAGIKTGSLFSCSCSNQTRLMSEIRYYNRVLTPKGLCLLPMKFGKGRALLYLFRPNRLKKDLQDVGAVRLLKDFGYDPDSVNPIAHLLYRLRTSDEFPHEIGLFLSYPPEDVSGFIENKAGGCKCIGTWKVYGNEETARKIFKQYKICTALYRKRSEQGMGLDLLAVAE